MPGEHLRSHSPLHYPQVAWQLVCSINYGKCHLSSDVRAEEEGQAHALSLTAPLCMAPLAC